MNLIQLRYFLAVVDAGSMNGAADALNIAQPAISRQIRNLELDLGRKLFERHDRGVTLTRHGEEYARQLRPLLARLDQLNQETRRHDPGPGKLRLGLNQFGQWHDIIVASLSAFREHNPSVVIEGEMTLSRQQIEAIEAGALDIAIGAPLRGLPSDFKQVFLFDMPMGALMAEDHPLASTDPFTLKHLRDFPLLAYARKTWPAVMDQLENRFSGSQSDLHITEVFDSSSVLLSRPLDGTSIAIVPQPGTHAPMAGLIFRIVEDLRFDVPIHLFWRDAEKGSATEAFIGEIRKMIRSAQVDNAETSTSDGRTNGR